MYKFIKIVLAALYIMVVTITTGCSNGTSSTEIDVPIDQALQMWESKEAIIIDVRTQEEYYEGHIPGVANIPLDKLMSRSSEVPKDKKVLLICRSGNRSSQGVKLLRSKEFTNVYNVAEGMNKWRGPVTR